MRKLAGWPTNTHDKGSALDSAFSGVCCSESDERRRDLSLHCDDWQ